ncbi:hypothetical protein EC973_001992 [Apophysomyces ossiformis]|uniref:Uncharacterized protein n=1 Tax=Apophysomyces ossiformis TaxID=679940 RepID=A0A8H7BLB0_9FUNG|nr:hypothetical protein EC973_001992 [Apophysomyces ossiformis]
MSEGSPLEALCPDFDHSSSIHTMPGFTLEEPFQLASFRNTIGAASFDKQFIVGLTQLETTTATTTGSEVESSADTDQVAITVQGEGVKLFNTTDQKCIRSWTTPPGVVFAGPAIHCTSGRDVEAFEYTYALVASGTDIPKEDNNKTVWLWKNMKDGEDDGNPANRITKKFDERIQSIHTSPSMGSHIILVNENGSIHLVSKELDRVIAKQKTKSDGQVIWSYVFVTSNSHARPCCVPNSMVPAMSTIVVTVSSSENSDIYSIRFHYVNEERRSINVLSKIDIKLDEHPIGFTLDELDGRMTMLGSGGTWTVWRTHLKRDSSGDIAGQLVKHLSIHLQEYRISDEILGNVAAVTPLSDSYVAMVASRVQKNSACEHVVSVWDVKYGTLQAEQTIKMDSSKEKYTYKITALPNSHLAITVSAIDIKTTKKGKAAKSVTSAKSNVFLCPYYSEPMSLMAAMGRMPKTAEFLGIDYHCVDNDKNIGLTRSGMDGVCFGVRVGLQDGKDVEESQKRESEILSQLLAPNITQEQFSKIFFLYITKSNTEHDAVDFDENMVDISGEEQIYDIEAQTQRYRERILQWQKLNKNVSHRFVSSIIRRCFASSNGQPDLSFWPTEVVLYLIAKSHLRSSYIENGLIKQLLLRDAWSMIPLALESVQDIPETDLIVIIQELIKLRESKPEWTNRFPTYLGMVIDAPRNDIFLQQALKQLTPTELPVILNALWDWFSCPPEETIMTNEALQNEVIKYTNMVDFSNCLLDIHFPTIILESSLHETIANLQQLIQAEAAVTANLEQLRGIFGSFERKRKSLREQQELQKEGQESFDAPKDELARHRRHNKGGKFGGEQGIPAYRVEIFRF